MHIDWWTLGAAGDQFPCPGLAAAAVPVPAGAGAIAERQTARRGLIDAAAAAKADAEAKAAAAAERRRPEAERERLLAEARLSHKPSRTPHASKPRRKPRGLLAEAQAAIARETDAAARRLQLPRRRAGSAMVVRLVREGAGARRTLPGRLVGELHALARANKAALPPIVRSRSRAAAPVGTGQGILLCRSHRCAALGGSCRTDIHARSGLDRRR